MFQNWMPTNSSNWQYTFCVQPDGLRRILCNTVLIPKEDSDLLSRVLLSDSTLWKGTVIQHNSSIVLHSLTKQSKTLEQQLSIKALDMTHHAWVRMECVFHVVLKIIVYMHLGTVRQTRLETLLFWAASHLSTYMYILSLQSPGT